jgi:protein-S-isoprenylcysteine O-methyltransferase Ste14
MDGNVWLLIKNIAFTVLVPGTVAVVVPVVVIRHGAAQPSLASVPAFVMLVIGGAVYAWCVWDFAVAGRGTPAPIDPPSTLVVRGLYRYSRNPMYVGVLSVIAGWATLFQSTSIAIYGACVAAAFHLFVLAYEEPHLRRVFGAAYVQYCSQVSRWVWLPRKN